MRLGLLLASLPALLLTSLLSACGDTPWNHPYPRDQAGADVLYASFSERPKHLDPARSYSSNEYVFIAQIYEPPLQYHFLKRPYELVPLSATQVPVPTYRDADDKPLPADTSAEKIAYSEYLIRIRPGIRYQPHPAFAKDEGGRPRYLDLTAADLTGINRLSDFPHQGTRELTAEDFVYQIKRLAVPWLHSPIAGTMKEHIHDFAALAERIEQAAPAPIPGEARPFLDLRTVPFAGAQVVDRYSYRIRIEGKYPQFLYWLAMPFFAPIPWEADRFYAQPGMKRRNLTLDWYPVGTGAFWLEENNPNLRMVLARNPNFHGESYPAQGMPGDEAAGLLADAGRPLPFIERAVYSLEKENIPYWNKFLQGYYDSSGISSDAFDQVIQFSGQGEALLTDRMREKGIGLRTAVLTSIYYMGFNMRDPVVGGDSERARLLRRAISIAVDYEEFIAIFANGRGIAAQGPIPPGIFGYREGKPGINPYVYSWRDGRAVRRGLEEAQDLLAQAGYPRGRDPAMGKALSLNYEAVVQGPDGKARLSWLRKQFKKLGIQLVVRATDYNRFQEKMRKGTGQIFIRGWNADYPDPENFLFLLYGPNSKVAGGGENSSNYANPRFDALFEQMKSMDNGPERRAVIDEMVEIARRDAPWLWGRYPKAFSLYHGWVGNLKPNLMANNALKYCRVDAARRERLRREWNRPVLWPLWLTAGLLAVGALPAVRVFRRRERRAALPP
ncbi:ABC transporter substrate-binding protein [Candidatus Thiosymbion oneisti]|uniref:ABC transporter substrate-binding protein n=1 Tax=Candidatus Thiosymbion oneisti TaxID=589554 RepID=UPI001FB82DDC|nr:ABC transporter substrate-binding protein [Candidatus Thiosymbion oneisti]